MALFRERLGQRREARDVDGVSGPVEEDASALAEALVSLGSELRQVRKARKLTLKQVALETGISTSHLSAIERGATNPSLEVVRGLADTLDIHPDWFFARRPGLGPMERAYVVRKRNRRDLNTLYREDKDEIGLTDALLSSSIGGRLLMGLAVYEPHSERPGHTIYQHEGEQHGLVVDGELELQIGDECMTLRAGDSFSFPTDLLHNLWNRTDRPAQLVWAIAPIVIPKDVVVGSAQNNRKNTHKDKATTGSGT
jgi:transcriptional regulator with XRE-family HTH domain